MSFTVWKVSKHGAFSIPYFTVFSSNYRKIRTRKNSVLDPFYALILQSTRYYTSSIYTSQICQITWSEIIKVRAKTCKLSMETDACYMNVNPVTLKLFSSKIITFRHHVLLREQTEKYFLSQYQFFLIHCYHEFL